MPKLPKFEDWTPPWKSDEFDADKAAKLIYNLHADKESLTERATETAAEKDAKITELSGKVESFETKDLNEVERLKRENEKLKNEKPSGDDLTSARLEIALEKGLTLQQAKRLAGGTRQEIAADADAYIAENGLGSPEGDGGQVPPSNRPKGNLKTGSERDNDEDDSSFDPAELVKDLPRNQF